MPTLDHLAAVRSQLALGLEAYLQAFADLSAWETVFLFTPKLRPEPMRAASLYQRPYVVNRGDLDEEARKRRAEADRDGRFGFGDASKSQMPWSEARRKPPRPSAGPTAAPIRRALILGKPGEGKTLLTQLTCRAVAHKSLARLRSRRFTLADIPIPVWLKVEDALAAGAIQDALDVEVPRAVLRALSRQFKGREKQAPSPTPAAKYIRSAWNRPDTWLFLDALDERNVARKETRDHPLALLQQLNDVRVVMTSRLHEYEPETDLPQGLVVTEYELEPLNTGQQAAFVNKWFGETSQKARDVLALIGSNHQFRDMASNGLMLTLMCVTAEQHQIDAATRRVGLYEMILRDLVRGARKKTPQRERLHKGDPKVDVRLAVLRRVAWHFFRAMPDETSLDVGEWNEQVQLASKGVATDPVKFAEELTGAIRDVGLVVSHRAGKLRFLHRSFFQYLVGSHVARERGEDALVNVIREHSGNAKWRETIIMAVGHLGQVFYKPGDAGAVVDNILSAPPGVPGVATTLMGDAVADNGEDCVPADTLERLKTALLHVMRSDGIGGRDPKVDPKDRAAAGRALGRIGDPRFHGPDRWCLPKFLPTGQLDPLLGFIPIPKGPFIMGSDKKQEPIDDAYWIARYPVTVAQFRAFVNDGAGNEGFTPGVDDCLLGIDNHPVVWVSWHEAMAYCAWLTRKLSACGDTPNDLATGLRHGYCVTLPIEAQFERAARGTNGRIYPWGPKFDQGRANCWEDDAPAIGSTSAVGCFPGGASPDQVEELSGNVCEWSGSAWTGPYDRVASEVRPDDDRRRVLRGGSFYHGRLLVRAADRLNREPGLGRNNVGFRVVFRPFRS